MTVPTNDWENFDGTITPGMAGFLHVQQATWGPGVDFGIQVPAGALPLNVGATDFSVRLLKKDVYLANQDANCGKGLPLILRLEPHGLIFNEPVTVSVTYMPWTDVRASDFIDKENLLWSPDPELTIYEIEEGTVTERRVKGGGYIVTLSYKVPHFSDWEVVGCREKPCPPPK